MNADIAKILSESILAYRETNDFECLTGVKDQVASLVAPDSGPEIGWQFAHVSHLAGNLLTRLTTQFEAKYGPLE